MSPGAFEWLIILTIFGLPVLAFVFMGGLLVFAVTRRRPNSAEDMAAIRELFDGLQKMEQRITSIETILVERHRRD